MNLCKTCGYPLKEGVKFCGNCGTFNTNEEMSTEFSNSIISDNVISGLEIKVPNSQQHVVNVWLVLGAVFIFCIFLPSIIGLDGFNGGFAISFVAVFMTIMSFIIILIYRSRAKQLRKILNGEGRVATWQYTYAEWQSFIEKDFTKEKNSKKALFYLVSVICIAIGIVMSLSLQQILFLIITLCIIPVVAIPALIAPRYRYNKLLHSPAQAIIAENGVVVGRMFHLWIKLGTTLDEVILNNEDGTPMLEFYYSMITRTGKQTEVARVPIPFGKMQDAESIGNYFANRKR